DELAQVEKLIEIDHLAARHLENDTISLLLSAFVGKRLGCWLEATRISCALEGHDESLADARKDEPSLRHCVAPLQLETHGLRRWSRCSTTIASTGLYGGKSQLQGVAQGRGRSHLADIRTQLDQSPCHARRDSRDDAVASHQPCRLRDPDEV